MDINDVDTQYRLINKNLKDPYMKGALVRIIAERKKQLSKGYDREHDRENELFTTNCLTKGARAYIALHNEPERIESIREKLWPYQPENLVDDGKIDNLVKAITMLMAQLEMELEDGDVN